MFYHLGSIPLNEIIGKIGKAMHGSRTERKTMTVAEARKALEEVEVERLTDDTEMASEAIANVEQNGIVVIDEIDKICSPEGDRYSGDASAEGVQRDLLPLIEGSVISTKHGNVNTDFILFVAAGAFHHCSPSDLLPELQGRLPIRVELKGLTQPDLRRILVEPEANLIKQQVALLGTENVELIYTDGCVWASFGGGGCLCSWIPHFLAVCVPGGSLLVLDIHTTPSSPLLTASPPPTPFLPVPSTVTHGALLYYVIYYAGPSTRSLRWHSK